MSTSDVFLPSTGNICFVSSCIVSAERTRSVMCFGFLCGTCGWFPLFPGWDVLLSKAALRQEPLAPGGSGRPQRQAAKPSVRINLPDQPDETITNQTSEGNLSSVGKLLKIFELGSQEVGISKGNLGF